MLPFQAPFLQNPNQNRNQQEPSNTSSLQQVSASNPTNISTNQQPQTHSQPLSINPHFPTQPNTSNPHFINFPNNFQPPQPQFFPQNSGFQLPGHFVNNLNFGVSPCRPHGQFFPNNHPQGVQFGQFNVSNFPQHVNSFTSFPQNNIGFPQVNPFNVAASNPCVHHSPGCLNQGGQGQGSQNPGFHMNPQMVMVNSNQMHNVQGQNMFTPPNMSQNGLNSIPLNASQNGLSSIPLINGGQAPVQQTQNIVQSNNPGKSQGNHAKDNGSNISNNNQRYPQDNGFARNQRDSVKREPGNARFQKSSFHPMGNARGNSRSFRGRGPMNKGSRNPYESTKQETNVENQSSRKLAVNYTEEEIQKWREERKKNHPSRINTDKKSEGQMDSEVSAAEKRRQQLKEILAKQAELGVEVAEIPRNYLLDSENQVNETEQNRTFTEKGRFKKRGGRRQKRGGMNRFNKKQKFGDNDSSPNPTFIKKNLTLLQKLLNPEIKRDKSHLLQAFRFMVLNSFLADWPNKPLEFLSDTVKETESARKLNGGISVTSGKDSMEEFKVSKDVAEDHDGKNSISEGESKGEEGEITD